MTTDSVASARKSLFGNLPVGRTPSVQVLLLVGAIITAACLFWIHHLRLTGQTGGLAPSFFVLFSFYDFSAAMLALAILLAAMFVRPWEGFDRLLRWLGEHPIAIATAVSVALSLGTLLVYHNHPLSMDEYAALFQSKVFASGELTGKFPVDLIDHLIPQGFQNHFLNVSKVSGEVSSSYWPSFALLLAPFSALGIPWACNPVLSGLTIIVLNRLALRLFGSVEAAGLVTLFTVASPVFFADGISYYSMTAHMLGNALFMLLLLSPCAGHAFAAGVVGSIALTLHNPVPHLLFALPWFVWLLFQPRPAARIGALSAGYLPLSIVLGIGWFMHSRDIVQSGGAESTASSLSGIASVFAWPTATLLYARLVAMAKLLLWAAPCLLLLAFAGAWRAHWDRRFVALAASAVLTFAGFLFVWADQGHGWGFRYFHSAWFVLPVFAAAFLHSPSTTTPLAEATPAVASSTTDVRTFVVACALFGLLGGVALRASQISEYLEEHLRQLPGYAGSEPRVVVLNGNGFYQFDLVQNDPFLRSDVVMMVDLGNETTAASVRRHFPDYHLVYRDMRGEVWSKAPPIEHAVSK